MESAASIRRKQSNNQESVARLRRILLSFTVMMMRVIVTFPGAMAPVVLCNVSLLIVILLPHSAEVSSSLSNIYTSTFTLTSQEVE